MKADLHVHSYHSGYSKYFRVLHARDCYSSPEDVYRVAKARGMDLVCITDHDSLDGCIEFLEAHPDAPDFLMGEEIECLMPDVPGLRIHLGAVGMTERVHRDLQPLRSNVFDVAAFLRAQGVFFSVNHLFLFFHDEMPVERYVRALVAVAPGLETHNGAALRVDNELVEAIRRDRSRSGWPATATGGSDAHSLQYVGTAYTETPATTREGFLADLAAGRTHVGGQHGGRARLMAEIYGVILDSWRSLMGLGPHSLRPWERSTALLLSAALLPAQFVPVMVACSMKAAENSRIRRYEQIFDGDLVQWAVGTQSSYFTRE